METQQLLRAVALCPDDSAYVGRLIALGEIASLLAQEVRNPLGAALFNAKAALNSLNAAHADLNVVREAILGVIESVSAASELPMTVAALAAQAGPIRLLDVNQAVLAAVKLSRGATRQRGARIKTELAPALPAVAGDGAQLQQVLVNLIRNAADAMSDIVDGRREILLSTQALGSRILVAVRDRGPRFDQCLADGLSKPFYSIRAGGMGVGLAFCCCIVEAHGGHICAVANNPCGTVVQFVLPTSG